jgi:hypothetical protein
VRYLHCCLSGLAANSALALRVLAMLQTVSGISVANHNKIRAAKITIKHTEHWKTGGQTLDGERRFAIESHQRGSRRSSGPSDCFA